MLAAQSWICSVAIYVEEPLGPRNLSVAAVAPSPASPLDCGAARTTIGDGAASGKAGCLPAQGKKRMRGRDKKRQRRLAAAEAETEAAAAGNCSKEADTALPLSNRLLSCYAPLLLFDFLCSDTALVVEQPWLRVMERFPPALFRHVFMGGLVVAFPSVCSVLWGSAALILWWRLVSQHIQHTLVVPCTQKSVAACYQRRSVSSRPIRPVSRPLYLLLAVLFG